MESVYKYFYLYTKISYSRQLDFLESRKTQLFWKTQIFSFFFCCQNNIQFNLFLVFKFAFVIMKRKFHFCF